MINVNTNIRDNVIEFIFDGGIFITKELKSYDIDNTSDTYSYYIIKRYREAIRDWLYKIHSEKWRKAEQSYNKLFILRLSINGSDLAVNLGVTQ